MPPGRYAPAYDPYADEYAAQLDPNYVAPAPQSAAPAPVEPGMYEAPYVAPGQYAEQAPPPVAVDYTVNAGSESGGNGTYGTPAPINQGVPPPPSPPVNSDSLHADPAQSYLHESAVNQVQAQQPKPQGELKPQDTYLGGINPTIPRSNAWNPIVPEQRNSAGMDNIQTQPMLQERHNTRGTDAFGQTGTDGTSDPHYVPPPATDPMGGNDAITGYNSGYGTPTGGGYGISDPSLGAVAPWSPDIAATLSGSDAAVDSTLAGIGTTLGQDAARGAFGSAPRDVGQRWAPEDARGSPFDALGGIAQGAGDTIQSLTNPEGRPGMEWGEQYNPLGIAARQAKAAIGGITGAPELAGVLGATTDPYAKKGGVHLGGDPEATTQGTDFWRSAGDQFGNFVHALNDPQAPYNKEPNSWWAEHGDPFLAGLNEHITDTENAEPYSLRTIGQGLEGGVQQLQNSDPIKNVAKRASGALSGISGIDEHVPQGVIDVLNTPLPTFGQATPSSDGSLLSRALKAGESAGETLRQTAGAKNLLQIGRGKLLAQEAPSFDPSSALSSLQGALLSLPSLKRSTPPPPAAGAGVAAQEPASSTLDQGRQALTDIDPEGIGQSLLDRARQGTSAAPPIVNDLNTARQGTKPGVVQGALDAGTAKAQQAQNVVTDKVQSTLGQQPQTDAMRRMGASRQAALATPPQQAPPLTGTANVGQRFGGTLEAARQQLSSENKIDAQGNLTGTMLANAQKAGDVDADGNWTADALARGSIVSPEDVGQRANYIHMTVARGGSPPSGTREATDADLAGSGVVATDTGSGSSNQYTDYNNTYKSGYTKRPYGGGGGSHSSGGGGGGLYGHPQPDIDQARSVLGPDFMKGFMDDFAFKDMFGPDFPFGGAGRPGTHPSTHKTGRKTKRKRTTKTHRGTTSHAPTKKPTSVGFSGSKKP